MNISRPHISLPSRLSLWLGVALLGVGFVQKITFLIVIGVLFVLMGALIWWFHAEKRWDLPRWMVKLFDKTIGKVLVRLNLRAPRYISKRQTSKESAGQTDLLKSIEKGQQSLKELNDVVEKHHQRYNGERKS